MNTILIVFLVIVIIVAIYIAIQYYNPSYLLNESKPLNINDPKPSTVQPKIIASEIDNPISSRYFYEGWFYINSNMPVKTENVLFNRANNFVVTLLGSTLHVFVNAGNTNGVGASTGVFDTNFTTKPSSGPTTISPFLTVNNFPFQKWTQLLINVDGNTLDLYIDGKFVQSKTSDSFIITNATDPIAYGNQYTSGSITRFRRPPVTINPQGVWSSYMNGSGQNTSISSSHLNLQITKNNVVKINQRIF